jgi:hypothetical protein
MREDSSEDEGSFNRTTRSEKWRERGRGKGRTLSGGAGRGCQGYGGRGGRHGNNGGYGGYRDYNDPGHYSRPRGDNNSTSPAAATTAAVIEGGRTSEVEATTGGGNPTERPLSASTIFALYRCLVFSCVFYKQKIPVM